MVIYHLFGALAQLVAHNTGSVGVRSSNLLCSTSKPGIILGMVPGFDIWRMEIDPLIKTLPEAGVGADRSSTRLDRLWVRNARKTVQWTVFSGERAAAPGEISTALFSTDKVRAAQWAVAPISVADRSSKASRQPRRKSHRILSQTLRRELPGGQSRL